MNCTHGTIICEARCTCKCDEGWTTTVSDDVFGTVHCNSRAQVQSSGQDADLNGGCGFLCFLRGEVVYFIVSTEIYQSRYGSTTRAGYLPSTVCRRRIILVLRQSVSWSNILLPIPQCRLQANNCTCCCHLVRCWFILFKLCCGNSSCLACARKRKGNALLMSHDIHSALPSRIHLLDDVQVGIKFSMVCFTIGHPPHHVGIVMPPQERRHRRNSLSSSVESLDLPLPANISLPMTKVRVLRSLD